jgi:putative redox protein
MVKATMKWAGGIKFEGTSAFGHKIVTDASKADGGEEAGFKPSELMLYSLGGCTGIDIVRILEKQNQQISGVEVELSAEQPTDYPKPFKEIVIRYTVRGKNLDSQKVARAIELSEQKYCTVGLTIQQKTPLKSSYKVVNE